jgi:hypothetical protein
MYSVPTVIMWQCTMIDPTLLSLLSHPPEIGNKFSLEYLSIKSIIELQKMYRL